MTASTRQVGEAVAWRVRAGVNHPLVEVEPFPWRLSEPVPSIGEGAQPEWFDIEPLIPASDLEQVSRERDEAVDMLIKAALGHTTRQQLRAFLNNMENRGGGGPG